MDRDHQEHETFSRPGIVVVNNCMCSCEVCVDTDTID